MKKIVLSLVFIAFVSACRKKTTTKSNITIDPHPIQIKYTFEGVIKESNYICKGTLKSKKTGKNILDNSESMREYTRKNYTIYTFDVTKTIYDSYGLEKAEVNIYTEKNLKFDESKEYFLPLTLVDYAYFVEDIFTIPGGLTLSFTDVTNNTINETDEIINKNGDSYSKSFKEYDLLNYVDTLKKGILSHYTKETNKDKIISSSPIIFKIKIGDLAYIRDSEYAKCETYIIEILDVVKGTIIDTTDQIKIEFLKDLVKKDDIVYVAVEPIGEMVIDSGFFYGLTSTTLLAETDFK